MKWKVEDTPERAIFREDFRSWLRESTPEGWVDSIDAGDEEAFAVARKGWNFLA